MKVEKNNSWKEKIAPSFDDLIKVYPDYIKFTHICSPDRDKKYKKYKKYMRYLFLDDESLKVLARKGYPPLPKAFKLNLKNLKELTNDIIALGASPDLMIILECFKNMEKPSNKNEKKKSKRENKDENSDVLKSSIMSAINGLSREDSRNYYKKALKVVNFLAVDCISGPSYCVVYRWN